MANSAQRRQWFLCRLACLADTTKSIMTRYWLIGLHRKCKQFLEDGSTLVISVDELVAVRTAKLELKKVER